ncbi:MAG: sulfurtransferase-like selenium metabolism protein YedF [Pseudomonadota bacterium]
MKTVEVNAKGLACPEPVVLTKKALDGLAEGQVIVLIDSENSRSNVVRMAESQGCTAASESNAAGFTVTISKLAGSAPAPEQSPQIACAAGGAGGEIVYLFDADYIGSNMELGKVLVNGFMNAALSLPHSTCAIVLISNAVRLAVKGSYALEVLAKLEKRGCRILICGTCLDFFKIRDQVQAGTVSNALEIMQHLTEAAKVIKF